MEHDNVCCIVDNYFVGSICQYDSENSPFIKRRCAKSYVWKQSVNMEDMAVAALWFSTFYYLKTIGITLDVS